jgi:hypothetical protein
MWLYEHTMALISELEYRKQTKYSMINNAQIILDGAKLIPLVPLTPFANCMPYKSIYYSIGVYRLCVVYKWEHNDRLPKMD